MTPDWNKLTIAPDRTHHLYNSRPAYEIRFREVLKFHAPGLAPVSDDSGAYHIDTRGRAAYGNRYVRTFGFYTGSAAIQSERGWFHILPDGSPLYPERYPWGGNFQEGRCTVRHQDGLYSHIRRDGRPAYVAHHRYVGDYRDGFAIIQREDGLHTHIDLEGNLTHGRWVLDLDVFHKGYARACDASGWHHVDLQGRAIYGRRFKAVEPFYNGQARVEEFDGSLLIVDETGNTKLTLRGPLKDPVMELSADMVGFWRTQAIKAAVELGLFDVLPARIDEIGEHLQLSGQSTLRLMRAMEELGLASKSNESTWMPSERGRLLNKRHPLSMTAAAQLWGTDHYKAWMGLAEALRSGRPAFEGRFGKSFFDWLQNRSTDLRLYHSAMSTYARHDYESLPDVIDFSKHRTVLDAGGGHGDLLFALLRANPQIRGIVFDRPEVVADADVPDSVADRCQFVPGDFFAPWPAYVDAVILARILHDWPDDRALTVLRHAHDALEETGRLYVVEMVLDDKSCSGGLLDLNMAVITGGKERTKEQFEELLGATAFRLIEVRDTPPVSSVLIAEPV